MLFSSCTVVFSDGDNSLLARANVVMLRQISSVSGYMGVPLSEVTVMIGCEFMQV